MKDIAIEEIRAVRHRMSEQCGHDLERFFAMLHEEEKEFQPQIQRFRQTEQQYQESSTPAQPEDVMLLKEKAGHER